MGSRMNVGRFAAVALVLVSLSVASSRAADAPRDVDFQRDVVYGKGGDHLTVASPPKRIGLGK